MRLALTLLMASCVTTACRSTTFDTPEGCRVNSNSAIVLADEFLTGQSLSWGDPTRITFDGTRFRLIYATPVGEPERSVLVDCVTGTVQIFVP